MISIFRMTSLTSHGVFQGVKVIGIAYANTKVRINRNRSSRFTHPPWRLIAPAECVLIVGGHLLAGDSLDLIEHLDV